MKSFPMSAGDFETQRKELFEKLKAEQAAKQTTQTTQTTTERTHGPRRRMTETEAKVAAIKQQLTFLDASMPRAVEDLYECLDGDPRLANLPTEFVEKLNRKRELRAELQTLLGTE